MPDIVSKIQVIFERQRPQLLELFNSLIAANEEGNARLHDVLHRSLNSQGLACAFADDNVFTVAPDDCVDHPLPGLLTDLTGGVSGQIRRHTNNQNPAEVSARAIRAAIGFGVANLLSALEKANSCRARIVFLFQPDTFLLKKKKVQQLVKTLSSVYSFDLNSSLIPGTVGIKPGAIFSSKCRFNIVLRLHNGSASKRDDSYLIHFAARLITALHQASSREIDPLTPVSIAVTSVKSGPDQASDEEPFVEIGGIIRTMEDSLHNRIKRLIEDAIGGVMDRDGVDFRCELKRPSPSIQGNQRVYEAARRMMGASHVRRLQYQGHGADRLAAFYGSRPGSVVHLGVQDMTESKEGSITDSVPEFMATIEAGVKVLAYAMSQESEQ